MQRNGPCERGVLWRKGSFGTDSAEGSRFAERIMTVVATCRQQKRNVLDFLVSALMANHGGHKAPPPPSSRNIPPPSPKLRERFSALW